MKTLLFLAITLISGAIAGTILGIINQGIVEPYIDKAVNIEVQNANKKEGGKAVDPNELVIYRARQKSGEIIGGTILGIFFSSLIWNSLCVWQISCTIATTFSQ